MGEFGLKKEYLDKIKKDPELFSKVFGKSPGSLDTTVSYGLQLLSNNDPKLTQASILRIIREHLGATQDSDLLTEMQEA